MKREVKVEGGTKTKQNQKQTGKKKNVCMTADFFPFLFLCHVIYIHINEFLKQFLTDGFK